MDRHRRTVSGTPRSRTPVRNVAFDRLNLDDSGDAGVSSRRALVPIRRRHTISPPRQEHISPTAAAAAARDRSITATGRTSERLHSPHPNDMNDRHKPHDSPDTQAQHTWVDAQRLEDIWGPETTRDHTLHFDMQVVEDVDSLLEELARFKRLGYFSAGVQYFRDKLEPFSEMAPVAIEYADLLMEQGAYGQLDRFLLSQRIVLRDLKFNLDHLKRLSQQMLTLIEAFSSMVSHGRMKEAYEAANVAARLLGRTLSQVPWSADVFDGAVIQSTRYTLKILSYLDRESELISMYHFDFLSGSVSLYKSLVHHGRVWDARDIMLGMLEAQGLHRIWKLLFAEDISSSGACYRMLQDWDVVQYDESTYLALLDILVGVGNCLTDLFFGVRKRSDLMIARQFLQEGSKLATCLVENNISLTASRPYLRWVLAEEEVRRKLHPGDMDLIEQLNKYPGFTILPGVLPIYLPLKTERPTEHLFSANETSNPSNQSHNHLAAVLSSARESADYGTEVLCLSELIHRMGPGINNLLSRLRHVQNNLQEDTLGHRKTVLTTFLFMTDDNCRQDLQAQIRSNQSRKDTFETLYLTDWCESMVARALSISLGYPAPSFRAALSKAYSFSIPWHVRKQIKDVRYKARYDSLILTDSSSDSSQRGRPKASGGYERRRPASAQSGHWTPPRSNRPQDPFIEQSSLGHSHYDKERLDPNDPESRRIMEMLRKYPPNVTKSPHQLDDETNAKPTNPSPRREGSINGDGEPKTVSEDKGVTVEDGHSSKDDNDSPHPPTPEVNQE
ncbi:hypothetical protein BJY04DRAFT_41666 [Aspergillus karnatakaensis]|uniref:uncharacterized protein n=1 Tax=Aspergillus karnatakaensis TaxID=1810916 RepID=UPI003CCDE20A